MRIKLNPFLMVIFSFLIITVSRYCTAETCPLKLHHDGKMHIFEKASLNTYYKEIQCYYLDDSQNNNPYILADYNKIDNQTTNNKNWKKLENIDDIYVCRNSDPSLCSFRLQGETTPKE